MPRLRGSFALAQRLTASLKTGIAKHCPVNKGMQAHSALKLLVVALGALPSIATAGGPVLAAGRWDVTSTVADIAIPGAPGFILRMMRGKSKAEHKRLPPAQGVEALLVPDPKAGCRVDSQRIADGRYAQALTCPQKRGEPMQIARAGTYDGNGFVGQATVTGTTPKGAMRIVLNQRAARIGN